ncbi:MAG: hypothetical protein ABL860_09590 [Candidatus Nitrotoga sp.]
MKLKLGKLRNGWDMKLAHKKLLMIVITALGWVGLGEVGLPVAHAADEQDVSKIKWSANAGLGYDGNAYRTHSGIYVDHSIARNGFPAINAPTIVPVIQSGFFVPFDLRGKYLSNRGVGVSLAARANADGRFYLEPSLTNANRHKLIGGIGINNLLTRKGRREESIYAGAIVGRVKNFFYDRDTGQAWMIGRGADKDISMRESYRVLGLEGRYKNEMGDIRYGVQGKLEDRTHDDPVVSDNFSNTYIRFGGHAEAKVIADSSLKLTYQYSFRDFKERNSRDLTGRRRNANGILQWSDNSYRASLRNKLGTNIIVYLDYGLTMRADNFQGYDDFTEHKFGIRLDYELGDVWRTRIAMAKVDVNYDNALAFNTICNVTCPSAIGQPRLTESRIDANIRTEYKLNKQQSVWVAVDYSSVDTNDLRYDYSRNQFMVGGKRAF